jgi:hypothetical protein
VQELTGENPKISTLSLADFLVIIIAWHRKAQTDVEMKYSPSGFSSWVIQATDKTLH